MAGPTQQATIPIFVPLRRLFPDILQTSFVCRARSEEHYRGSSRASERRCLSERRPSSEVDAGARSSAWSF